jgi:hypothetical protein
MTRTTAVSHAPENLWAVILVEEDTRAPHSQSFEGGSHQADSSRSGIDSLLRSTITRTQIAVPLDRTLVVDTRLRASPLASEFSTSNAPRLMIHPHGRRTASTVLLPVHWIRRQEPNALVAIFPAEQVILEPFVFMEHVVQIARFVEREAREIVLVGARPTHPETQCGWIETSELLPGSGDEPIWRVSRLRENLSYFLARACYESGALWNTGVIVARAEGLLQQSRRRLPELDARMETAAALDGTPYGRRALEECHVLAPRASFFESVLAGALQRTSASRLPPARWTDRSSVERIPGDVRGARHPAARPTATGVTAPGNPVPTTDVPSPGSAGIAEL